MRVIVSLKTVVKVYIVVLITFFLGLLVVHTILTTSYKSSIQNVVNDMEQAKIKLDMLEKELAKHPPNLDTITDKISRFSGHGRPSPRTKNSQITNVPELSSASSNPSHAISALLKAFPPLVAPFAGQSVPHPHHLMVRQLFPRLKVYFCGIPKNVHTQFYALFCLASDPVRNHNITGDPMHVYHWSTNCHSVIAPDEIYDDRMVDIWSSNDWHKLTIVRDPIDRFLSGYLDFCSRRKRDCYGCQNMHCFAEHNYYTMLSLANSKRFNFSGVMEPRINHFYPQSWYCEFGTPYGDQFTILRFQKRESFRQHARYVMDQFGIPRKFVHSSWGGGDLPFLGNLTKHTTKGNWHEVQMEQLLRNRTTVNYILATYSIDYDRFKFPVPKVMWRPPVRRDIKEYHE